MNAKRFRVVFNRMSSMWVAAPETAAGHGRGRSAARARRPSMPLPARPAALWLAAHAGAVAGLCVVGFQPALVLAQATLPVTPDRHAPGPHPVVGVAGHGVPVVNIVAPNGAGLSHNHFTDYNVGTAGMVLNNSGGNAPTRVAGWVQGNPFIGNHPARTILNEVNSGRASRLLGMTEVAGQRANVVIANPAGLYCNGCGFINAPRVTLTTGVPVFEAGGTLGRLDVTQGVLTVDGQGLDARSSSRIELIARAMRINGEIWAHRLEALAGANQVTYADNRTLAQAGAGTAPQVAIDVAALGGMYADTVRLVSTGEGVGVNLGGGLNSLTGDLQVASNGEVTIAPGGALLAAREVALQGRSIRNAGTLAAQAGARLTAADTLENRGSITARGDVSGTAQRLDNTGTMAAGVAADGNVSQPGSVKLTAAGTLGNAGALQAGNDVTLRAAQADLSHGSVRGVGAVNVSAAGALAHVGAELAGNTVELQAGGTLDNRQASIVGGSQLRLSAGALDNRGGAVSSQGGLRLDTGEVRNAGGQLAAQGDLDIHAARVGNQGGTLGSAAGNAAIAAQAIDNTGGVITADTGTLSLDAAGLNNRQGILQAHGALAIATHGQALDNRGGLVSTKQDMTLAAGVVDNSAQGAMSAAGSMALEVAQLNNDTGALTAQRGLRIAARDTISNRAGTLGANGAASFTADTLDNDRGLVHAGGELTLQGRRIINTRTQASAADHAAGIEAARVSVRAAHIDNAAGAIRSDEATRIDTDTLDNTHGALDSSGTLEIAATGNVTNTQGDINGGAHAVLAAHGLTGDGTVQSRGDVRLTLQSDFANTGTILAEHDAQVLSAGKLVNAGAITAGHALEVSAQAIENTRTGVLAGNHSTQVAAAHTLDNDGLINGGATHLEGHDVYNTGRVYGDSITIEAATLVNEAGPGAGTADGAGVIASRGDMDLAVATLTNREGGYILADRDLRIGGALDGEGHATGSANHLTNDSATLEAGGDAVLNAARIDNLNSHFATAIHTASDATPHYFYALPGSSNMLPGATTWLYHANGKPYELRSGNQNAEHSLQGDYSWYLVLPSEKYPQQRYGPPFDYAGEGNPLGGGLHHANGWHSYPVGLAYTPGYTGTDVSDNLVTLPEQFGYTLHDKIWAVFGVSAPEPLPPEPVSPCRPTDVGCRAAFHTQHVAWEQARAGYIAQYQALNDAITAFNSDFHSRLVQNFDVYTITNTTTTGETVTHSAPGQILAGGDLTLAGALNNDKSRIAAGRDLNGTGAQTLNADALGTRTTVAHGTLQYTYKGKDREWQMLDAALEQTLASETVHLSILPTDARGQPEAMRTVVAASSAAQGAGGDIDIGIGIAPGGSAVANLGSAVIRTMAPPLRLPNNALYRTRSDPGSHYLVETDPAYASFRTWMSSDTMIRALNQSPDKTIKRLGDGFYEQQLVAQQVLGLTGQRFTGDYTNTQDEYAALLANGAQAAQALQLTVGTALSDTQMAALTGDIVWLVKRTVTLPDGSAQEVLAPQVYLQAKHAEVTGSGALIAGKNVALDNHGTLHNSGTIAGRDVTAMRANAIENVNGALAGKVLTASAVTDLNNLGGAITADAAVLEAGRDINLGSQAWSSASGGGMARGIGALGTVNAGTLALGAGRDLNLTAAALNTTGDMTLTAQRDVNLKTLQTSVSQHAAADSRNQRTTTQGADVGSQLSTGGNLAVVAGRDLNATAATVSAGDALTMAAGHDVNLRAGQASQSVSEDHHYETHGFLSSKKATTQDSTASTSALGTTLSGATVDVRAGHDLTAQATTIAGTQGVKLAAGHDLTLATAATGHDEHHFQEVRKSGLGAAGPGLSWGTNQTKDTRNDTLHGAQGSLIGSTDGSVHLQAGNRLHISGSDVLARQDVTGVASEINIDASRADRHHDETHEIKTSGFSLGIQAPVLDALQNVRDQAEGAGASQDGRAAALHAMAAASGLWDAGGIAKNTASTLQGGQKPDAKVQLSWGTSHSKSTFTEDRTEHRGTNIQAGGTAAFVAQGNGAPGSGNLSIVGSDVNAQNVLLQAANQINLLHSTDTQATRSENESSSASLGVSLSATGGWGVAASKSQAHGDGNSDAALRNNTHIHGAQNVAIVSGGDTNLIGATVSGRYIETAIGGDLNLASVQDTSTSAAHQKSSGGGLSISQGGASGSLSSQHGNASGSYAAVNEQSGMLAGDGGFDIRVQGNTDLKGAYIASTASPDKNRLTTGTLSFSDVQNQSSYDAQSGGVTMGASYGNGGNSYRTHGSSSGINTGGPVPMLGQHDSGSDSAATRGGISAGAIHLTDETNQRQDLASLNRDTSNLNGTVAQTPDLNQLLNNQADMMAAVSAAGEAMARRIGEYAHGKQQAAKAAGDKAEADKWAEGGTYRVAMQTAGMLVMTGMSGGDVLGGAAGAAVSAASAKALNRLAGAIADANPTGNPDMNAALGNIVASSLAGAIGGIVGGDAGAFAGANVDRYNRELHPEEYAEAKKNAKITAQELGVSEQEAEGRIVAEMLRNSDQQTADASGGKHDYEIRSIVGCQNLNCDGYKNDLNYANHDYNSEYIALNQGAYDLGQTQIGMGLTYDGLVSSNYDKDPLGNTIARAGGSLLAGLATGGLAAMWGIGTAFTYVGDAISYQFRLSQDQPNYKNAAISGGVIASMSSLLLPLNTLGNATGGKIAVGIYNSLVGGTGAFGATAMTNPGSSPELSAGISAAGTLFGMGVMAKMPGPAGISINQLVQALSGPTQAAIESGKQKER